MEEAATVPVVYTLAYYCVMMKANVQPGETVVILAGLSNIGQAVIKLALEVGAIIVTSVDNDDQQITLMKLFPQLDARRIIVLDRQDVATCVSKLTDGKGAKVVVSCMRGKVLQSCIKSMGIDCRFLHLSQIKPVDCESIGMLAFLRRTSFHGVSLDSVAHCSQEWKVILRDLLQAGIRSGTVRSFQKNVYPSSRHHEAIQSLKSPTIQRKTIVSLKTNDDKMTKSMTNRGKDLAVTLSKSTKSQLWVDVVEWLIKEGYRWLVVIMDEDKGTEGDTEDHFRRLDQLIHRHNSYILVTPSNRLDSAKSSRCLVKELMRLGNVSTIFNVKMCGNNERMVNLEAATRSLSLPVRQWVSLLCEGEGVSESRAAAGLPVCCVRGLSPLQHPVHLLRDLSAVLDEDQPESRFFIVNEKTSTHQEKVTEYSKQHILGHQSLEKMIQSSDLVTDRPVFSEGVTRSPGHRQVCHNLLPLFVIPGLCDTSLNSLLQSLIHPAFISSFPLSVLSVQEHASFVLQDLLRIQKKGKYNILGDIWSSAVTLEVGCLLEARGHQVQLFLLEGGPSMAQDRLTDLSKKHKSDLATGLLADLFNLSPEITRKLSELQSWEEKLSSGLRAGQVPEIVRDKVGRVVSSACSQLMALQLFNSPSRLFRGQLTLICHQEPLSTDVANLSQMCKHTPKVKVTNDKSHRDLLLNFDTAIFINDKMFYDWSL